MATEEPVAAAPAKAKNAKKSSSAPKKRNPTYFEMIKEAIVTLKERTGSSSPAISKFIENKYKNLPANYKTILSNQLKKSVADGKLVKVKASYKLPSKRSLSTAAAAGDSSSLAKKPVAKPKTAAKKPKSAPAKKKAGVGSASKSKAVPKAKAAVAKVKATAASKAVKPKVVAAVKSKVTAATAKLKASVKPKPKVMTPTKPAAKSARTSTRSTPDKTTAPAVTKLVAKKAAVKKSAAKKGKK